MPEATNDQMQRYADERLRPFSEAAQKLLLEAQAHKAAIDDIYARAIGTNRWNDARTDGPPHLLQSGNSANPDDMTNFNAFITNFIAFFAGEATWPTLQRAEVRSIV